MQMSLFPGTTGENELTGELCALIGRRGGLGQAKGELPPLLQPNQGWRGTVESLGSKQAGGVERKFKVADLDRLQRQADIASARFLLGSADRLNQSENHRAARNDDVAFHNYGVNHQRFERRGSDGRFCVYRIAQTHGEQSSRG